MFLGIVFSAMATIAGLYYAYTPAVLEQQGVFYRTNWLSMERLSYLSELGIDAIWISQYDKLENLDEWIQVCKQRNIRVVTDSVEVFNNAQKIAHMIEERWPVYSLSDTRYGNSPEKARLAAMLLLTLEGTPVLSDGEEIGISVFEEMPSVEEQKEDYDGSLYWLYRKLIYLRKENLSLKLGSQIIQEDTDPDILIYSRSHEKKTVWIALNMGEHTVTLTHLSAPKVHLSTYPNKSDGLALRPFEGIIWSYKDSVQFVP